MMLSKTIHTQREINMANTERDKAIKKIQIAIDKVIAIQDMGLGCGLAEEALAALRALESSLIH